MRLPQNLIYSRRAAGVSRARWSGGVWKRPARKGNDVLVSVVIPVHAEADAIVPVLDETIRSLDAAIKDDYEIIVVDDDAVGDVPRLARAGHPSLRILRHARPAGLSGALRTGVAAA